MDEFTPLERAVMDKLLEGDDPENAALRAQWNAATLNEREYTGVGFYTTFFVPIELQIRPGGLNLDLTGLHGRIEGHAEPVAFNLFVGAGFIQTLEGYTFGDKWPGEIRSFTLEES